MSEILDWANSVKLAGNTGGGAAVADPPVENTPPVPEDDILTWAKSVKAPPVKRKFNTVSSAIGPPVQFEVFDEPKTIEEALIANAAGSGQSRQFAGAEYFGERLPFIGGAQKAGKLGLVLLAAQHVEAGAPEQGDYDILAEYLNAGEREGQKGVLRRIADMATAIPGFGIEYMATTGGYAAGKKVTTEAIEKTVGKLIGKRAGAIATGIAARGVGVLGQTALNPQLVASSVVGRLVGQHQLAQDASGALTMELAEDPEAFGMSLLKGTEDAAIELGSERAGRLIGDAGKGLGWLASKVPGSASVLEKLTALKAATISKWLGTGKTAAAFSKKLKEAGWNGVIGEMYEEELGKEARGVAGIEPYKVSSLKELGIQAASFLVIPGAQAAVAAITPGQPPTVPPATAAQVPPGSVPPPVDPLADLQAIRAKGFVSTEDGKSLGLTEEELTNRKTRLKAVDDRIKQLAQETQDAPEVPKNKGVVEEAGQVGPGGQVDSGGGVREGGQVEVPEVPAVEVPAQAEVPIAKPTSADRFFGPMTDAELQSDAQEFGVKGSNRAEIIAELLAQPAFVAYMEENLPAEEEVAKPVELWQTPRDQATTEGWGDNWSSVVRRGVNQGKPVPQEVRDELAAYDAEKEAKRKPATPEPTKPKVGDTVVRYTHKDGTGLLNNSGLDRSKLTDDEENELVELMDLGLKQPPEGTKGTFYFTQDGEKQHARMLELLQKASKSGIVRTESALTSEPAWQSDDGQISVDKAKGKKPSPSNPTPVVPKVGKQGVTKKPKAVKPPKVGRKAAPKKPRVKTVKEAVERVATREPEQQQPSADEKFQLKEARRRVQRVAKSLETALVAKPGAVKVEETAEGWQLTLPTGRVLRFRRADAKIKVNEAVAGEARGVTPEQIKKKIGTTGGASGVTASAGYVLELADGTSYTFDEVMVAIDPELAASTTARHEALHLARMLGFFDTPQGQRIYAALAKKYEGQGLSESQIEEKIADVRGIWEGPEGLWAKIREFISKFMEPLRRVARMGMNPELAMGKTFGKKFWSQEDYRNPEMFPGTTKAGPLTPVGGITYQIADVEKTKLEIKGRGLPGTVGADLGDSFDGLKQWLYTELSSLSDLINPKSAWHKPKEGQSLIEYGRKFFTKSGIEELKRTFKGSTPPAWVEDKKLWQDIKGDLLIAEKIAKGKPAKILKTWVERFLSTNIKTGGFSWDFALMTCLPTERCSVCYAKSMATVEESVSKARLRHTIVTAMYPKVVGKVVGQWAASQPKGDFPFLRVNGAGDSTFMWQVDAINAAIEVMDRPVHIFSRSHRARTQDGGSLGAISNGHYDPKDPSSGCVVYKMGSVDKQLRDEYGDQFLKDNLEKRGIFNSYLVGSVEDVAIVKEMHAKGIFLILHVNATNAIVTALDNAGMLATSDRSDSMIIVPVCACALETGPKINGCATCLVSGGPCFAWGTQVAMTPKGKLYTYKELLNGKRAAPRDGLVPMAQIGMPSGEEGKQVTLEVIAKSYESAVRHLRGVITSAMRNLTNINVYNPRSRETIVTLTPTKANAKVAQKIAANWKGFAESLRAGTATQEQIQQDADAIQGTAAMDRAAEKFAGRTPTGASTEGVSYQIVSDKSLQSKLDSEPTIKVFRAMQLVDGKLYPPMSGKVGRKWRNPTPIGVWEQADESPELVDDKGLFKLNKGNQKSITARYNPYFHTSRSPLNDQFAEAYKRPNLVTVEVEVPASELTSGYKADKAKDSVGEMSWHAGPVSGKLPPSKKRTVILSRYAKVVRVVPDAEVADKIATMLSGENIEIPYQVVTPALRDALIARGVAVQSPGPSYQLKPGGWQDTVLSSLQGHIRASDSLELPQLWEQVQAQHPDVTLKEFQDGLVELADAKQLKLDDYTRAWADVMDNPVAIKHPREYDEKRGYGLKWYVRGVAGPSYSIKPGQTTREALREYLRKKQAEAAKATAGPARPDLAKMGETPDVRSLEDFVDVDRNERGQPTPTTREEMNRVADQMLVDDYDGMRDKLMKAAQKGVPLDQFESLAAKKIFNREAASAFVNNDLNGIFEAMTLSEGWRNIGTIEALAFANRADPIESPAERKRRTVAEAIMTPPEKMRKERKKAREEGDHAAADAINKKWAAKMEDLKNSLKASGIDLDQVLAGKKYTPEQKSKPKVSTETRRKEVAAACDKFNKIWKSKATSGLDPELVVAAVDVVRAYVKLGVANFSDFMAQLKSDGVVDDVSANRDVFEKAWDIANNPDALSDQRYLEILRAVSAAKSIPFDKMYEYWNNAVLSGIPTQIANIAGNSAHGMWHFTAERLLRSTLNLALRQKEESTFKEMAYVYAGILPGFVRGARNMILTFQTEMPTLESQLGLESSQKIEGPRVAIGGKLGRVVRSFGYRPLTAADEFFKSLFTEMEAGGQAYRIAKMEGRSGTDLQTRIADLMADQQSPVWKPAYDVATELTFQQKGGKAIQAAKQSALYVRNAIPFTRYIVPYVNTPANIFAVAVRKSPFGVFSSVKIVNQMYANFKAGKPVFTDVKANVPLIAEQALAWAVVLVLLGTNDDDDPWITGAEGSLKQAKKEVGYRTRPPMSVWLGNKWHSYARVPEPFSTILGMTVDATNSVRSGDPGKMVSVPIDSLVGQMENKTFLRGLSDFLGAVRGTAYEGSTEGLTEWASNFSVSWVPNIVRSTSREASGEYMNRRVWMTGEDWAKQLARRTVQKTELHILKDYPLYDVWGRPAQRSTSPVGADWIYRILVPVRNQTAEMFVADRVILNWNNSHKEDEASYPLTPKPSYERGGKTTRLNEKQYADFVRLAGETATKALTGKQYVDLDPENPKAGHVEWIHDVVSETRSQVLDALIAQWEGKGTESDVTIDVEKLAKNASVTVKERWLNSKQSTKKSGETAQGFKYRSDNWRNIQKDRSSVLRK